MLRSVFTPLARPLTDDLYVTTGQSLYTLKRLAVDGVVDRTPLRACNDVPTSLVSNCTTLIQLRQTRRLAIWQGARRSIRDPIPGRLARATDLRGIGWSRAERSGCGVRDGAAGCPTDGSLRVGAWHTCTRGAPRREISSVATRGISLWRATFSFNALLLEVTQIPRITTSTDPPASMPIYDARARRRNGQLRRGERA